MALYRAGAFAEASVQVDRALAFDPQHPGARRLRQDLDGVLANRQDRLQMAAAWFASLHEVRAQELAVRLAALKERADRALAAGDFEAAELDYDRIGVAIRSFPYAFDWGELPQEIATKQAMAREKARQLARIQQEIDARAAQQAALAQAEAQAEALRLKVDELLRRARDAYARKDYRRAEIEAWNAYELDRRREDARELYLAARREGHALFDEQYRIERQEGLARIAEEVHKSLIPQNELLVYPEDWQRRAQRQPKEIGSQKVEAWRAALNDRLEQRVTFEFQDQSFEDVVAFLRQTTGINIVVSPQVLAQGGGTVTLKVRDMRLRDALRWILDITGWHMAIQDQAVFINHEPVTGAAILRLYDVTDLITPVRSFPGIDMAYRQAASGGTGNVIAGAAQQEESEARKPEELVEFIKNNVTRGQWDPQRNIDITQRSGSTLFVSHTPEGHKLVEQLLDNLRKQTALQVSIDVRVLDVRKGFFEEIGVEWHNNPQNMIAGQQTEVGYGTIRRQDSANNSGYSLQGTVYQRLPGNATQANYGVQPAIVPGSPLPRGLVLETAFNTSGVINLDQVNAIFSAAQDETDATVLAQPSLTCFNGQRANALFINQYAYISDYEVQAKNYDPVITVLNYGDQLDVRPVVSSDRKYITMEIRPENITLQGVYVENLDIVRVLDGQNDTLFLRVSIPLELPNVLVQTMRATVMLPDRGSLLIGGYNRALRQRTHSGVPFLSHIPFLGRLFSRDGTYDEQRRQFYLLSARILDLAEAEAQQ
ncbi:MAG: hypothetical protein NZ552_08260 [Planctomycetes bacterium]|nr:hypothetical protein [Planctomycetota bacterium]